jgi:uncharacterized membrane protein YeiH
VTSPTTPLHELPAWIGVSALAVVAFFAAHLARVRQAPLHGVLLAGVLGGLSGAIARDVLLGLEPSAIKDWYYVPAIVVAAVIGSLVPRRVSLRGMLAVAADAVAIALLIGIGVQKAVQYRTPGPPAILIGVVAATVGGALDDMLSGRQPAVVREGPWLLVAVVLGAAIFWLFTIYVAFWLAVAITVGVVTSLRVMSINSGRAGPVAPSDDSTR